jgi:hypothetical protein
MYFVELDQNINIGRNIGSKKKMFIQILSIPICESLKQAAELCNRKAILMSFIPRDNDTKTKCSDQTFMYIR